MLQSVGGVEVYLRLITENINPDKVESVIIHQKSDNKKEYLDGKGRVIKQYIIPIQREISLFKDLKAIRDTIKFLKEEKPDVIHAHSAKGGIVARVASLFCGVKVLHTPHAYSYLSADSKIKRTLFLYIEKYFKYFNSHLLATSNSEMNRGIKDLGYNRANTTVFNNSILPNSNRQFNQIDVSEYNLPDNYICTVGRPSYQKNIEMMLRVVSQVKKKVTNLHLVIMGVGEYSPNKDAVVSLIKELNLDKNVTLINWIEREKIFSIIDKSKLYISTSRYEGLPYSIIESLSLSKACVVTDCDGNRDLVKDGYNGFLIKNNDEILMVNKIIELLENKELRTNFEKNSLEFFNKEFNLEKNISKLEDIYIKYKKN